jgi:hypothetical protein
VNKRVLFILSHGGMNTMVAGKQTAADGAFRAAGLQNAMQGFDHYRSMSQEGVIASQPDLVVISADGLKGMGGEAGLWKLPGLAQTPAGRHKQVLVIDDMALLGFGPRTRRRCSRCGKKRSSCPDAPHPARHLWLMTLLLIVLTLFATTLGAMRLPLASLLPAGDEILRHIWLTIRLPRVLLALLVGAALALSGCVMQGLFRNPRRSGPVGISSGAALAVACWLVLPLSVPRSWRCMPRCWRRLSAAWR